MTGKLAQSDLQIFLNALHDQHENLEEEETSVLQITRLLRDKYGKIICELKFERHLDGTEVMMSAIVYAGSSVWKTLFEDVLKFYGLKSDLVTVTAASHEDIANGGWGWETLG